MRLLTLVKPGLYRDSVVLLALARELRGKAGVAEAAALMATPANRELLAQAGLLTPEASTAGPNDLVVVLRADQAAAQAARERAEELLTGHVERGRRACHVPRTIESAHRRLPGADLALISVPGAWAAAEARKALDRGLHVMLFSDNVALDDEIELKRLAARRGLLLMGPDCGTAYLGGAPLGFANVVPRGRIGIAAASGTGLQQVAALLAARGEGISEAIGVGGRDMSECVGGVMTLAALAALDADAATEVIVVIGKPPAPGVGRVIEAKVRSLGKPAVLALLGRDVATGHDDGVTTVATLEDACRAALAGPRWSPRPFSLSPDDVARRVTAARAGLARGQTSVRGFFAGGTLAHEALLILEPWLGPVDSNLAPRQAARHRIVDLGADEHTVGRAHPMLDPTGRITAIAGAAEEADAAVILLDVVLGLGAAADPAGDVAPAIETARARARRGGRTLAVVASVIGTDADPQGLARQTARLEQAGVWVLPSNAQAARAAAAIAGGEAVLAHLLGDARQ